MIWNDDADREWVTQSLNVETTGDSREPQARLGGRFGPTVEEPRKHTLGVRL